MTNKISIEIIVNNKCGSDTHYHCICDKNTVITLENALDVLDELMIKGSYNLQSMDVAVVCVYSLPENVELSDNSNDEDAKELLWTHKVCKPYELLEYVRSVFSVAHEDNAFIYNKYVSKLKGIYEEYPKQFIEEYFSENKSFPCDVEIINVPYGINDVDIYTKIGKYIVNNELKDVNSFIDEFIDYEAIGEKYVDTYGIGFCKNFVYKKKGK